MRFPDIRCAVHHLASRDIRLFVLWIGLPSLSASALAADVAGQQNAGCPDVVFTCNFESPEWYREWGLDQPEPGTDTVAADPALKFEPLDGKALCVRIPKGGQVGMGKLKFRFKERTGSEPEEIYFRYYLRFADDWDPQQNGKLPGVAGTYQKAGWGGKRVNGRDGWSARGRFDRQLNGETPIGYYCYHADMQGNYGSPWLWEKDHLGYLKNNRWYCVEQHVKMNTPGRNDGLIQGWIDGQLAFEKTDVRLRDVSDLKIEMVWMDVYQGGKKPATSEDHLYIDSVVVARSYIGPLKK